MPTDVEHPPTDPVRRALFRQCVEALERTAVDAGWTPVAGEPYVYAAALTCVSESKDSWHAQLLAINPARPEDHVGLLEIRHGGCLATTCTMLACLAVFAPGPGRRPPGPERLHRAYHRIEKLTAQWAN